MPTLTCDHCPAEIDVVKDPRCVVYDPSGATDVKCKRCRELEWERWRAGIVPNKSWIETE